MCTIHSVLISGEIESKLLIYTMYHAAGVSHIHLLEYSLFFVHDTKYIAKTNANKRIWAEKFSGFFFNSNKWKHCGFNSTRFLKIELLFGCSGSIFCCWFGNYYLSFHNCELFQASLTTKPFWLFVMIVEMQFSNLHFIWNIIFIFVAFFFCKTIAALHEFIKVWH